MVPATTSISSFITSLLAGDYLDDVPVLEDVVRAYDALGAGVYRPYEVVPRSVWTL